MIRLTGRDAQKRIASHSGRCDQCGAPHWEFAFFGRLPGATRRRVLWIDGRAYDQKTGEYAGPAKPTARVGRVIKLQAFKLTQGRLARGPRFTVLCSFHAAELQRPAREERWTRTGRRPGRPRKE